jgi:hypothetical protein
MVPDRTDIHELRAPTVTVVDVDVVAEEDLATLIATAEVSEGEHIPFRSIGGFFPNNISVNLRSKLLTAGVPMRVELSWLMSKLARPLPLLKLRKV